MHTASRTPHRVADVHACTVLRVRMGRQGPRGGIATGKALGKVQSASDCRLDTAAAAAGKNLAMTNHLTGGPPVSSTHGVVQGLGGPVSIKQRFRV
eukprot:scaffold67579_cov62-Phaeocystis_antarctica.AAC.1